MTMPDRFGCQTHAPSYSLSPQDVNNDTVDDDDDDPFLDMEVLELSDISNDDIPDSHRPKSCHTIFIGRNNHESEKEEEKFSSDIEPDDDEDDDDDDDDTSIAFEDIMEPQSSFLEPIHPDAPVAIVTTTPQDSATILSSSDDDEEEEEKEYCSRRRTPLRRNQSGIEWKPLQRTASGEMSRFGNSSCPTFVLDVLPSSKRRNRDASPIKPMRMMAPATAAEQKQPQQRLKSFKLAGGGSSNRHYQFPKVQQQPQQQQKQQQQNTSCYPSLNPKGFRWSNSDNVNDQSPRQAALLTATLPQRMVCKQPLQKVLSSRSRSCDNLAMEYFTVISTKSFSRHGRRQRANSHDGGTNAAAAALNGCFPSTTNHTTNTTTTTTTSCLDEFISLIVDEKTHENFGDWNTNSPTTITSPGQKQQQELMSPFKVSRPNMSTFRSNSCDNLFVTNEKNHAPAPPRRTTSLRQSTHSRKDNHNKEKEKESVLAVMYHDNHLQDTPTTKKQGVVDVAVADKPRVPGISSSAHGRLNDNRILEAATAARKMRRQQRQRVKPTRTKSCHDLPMGNTVVISQSAHGRVNGDGISPRRSLQHQPLRRVSSNPSSSSTAEAASDMNMNTNSNTNSTSMKKKRVRKQRRPRPTRSQSYGNVFEPSLEDTTTQRTTSATTSTTSGSSPKDGSTSKRSSTRRSRRSRPKPTRSISNGNVFEMEEPIEQEKISSTRVKEEPNETRRPKSLNDLTLDDDDKNGNNNDYKEEDVFEEHPIGTSIPNHGQEGEEEEEGTGNEMVLRCKKLMPKRSASCEEFTTNRWTTPKSDHTSTTNSSSRSSGSGSNNRNKNNSARVQRRPMPNRSKSCANLYMGLPRQRRRSKSPRSNRNTPSKMTSTRDRSNSPRRRTSSARNRSDSPRRRNLSPRNRSNSPRQRNRSPRNRSNSPRSRSNHRSRSPRSQRMQRTVETSHSRFSKSFSDFSMMMVDTPETDDTEHITFKVRNRHSDAAIKFVSQSPPKPQSLKSISSSSSGGIRPNLRDTMPVGSWQSQSYRQRRTSSETMVDASIRSDRQKPSSFRGGRSLLPPSSSFSNSNHSSSKRDISPRRRAMTLSSATEQVQDVAPNAIVANVVTARNPRRRRGKRHRSLSNERAQKSIANLPTKDEAAIAPLRRVRSMQAPGVSNAAASNKNAGSLNWDSGHNSFNGEEHEQFFRNLMSRKEGMPTSPTGHSLKTSVTVTTAGSTVMTPSTSSSKLPMKLMPNDYDEVEFGNSFSSSAHLSGIRQEILMEMGEEELEESFRETLDLVEKWKGTTEIDDRECSQSKLEFIPADDDIFSGDDDDIFKLDSMHDDEKNNEKPRSRSRRSCRSTDGSTSNRSHRRSSRSKDLHHQNQSQSRHHRRHRRHRSSDSRLRTTSDSKRSERSSTPTDSRHRRSGYRRSQSKRSLTSTSSSSHHRSRGISEPPVDNIGDDARDRQRHSSPRRGRKSTSYRQLRQSRSQQQHSERNDQYMSKSFNVRNLSRRIEMTG